MTSSGDFENLFSLLAYLLSSHETRILKHLNSKNKKKILVFLKKKMDEAKVFLWSASEITASLPAISFIFSILASERPLTAFKRFFVVISTPFRSKLNHQIIFQVISKSRVCVICSLSACICQRLSTSWYQLHSANVQFA